MNDIICMIGPTAVGKTAAIEALSGLPIEVISADSMQLYRKMDLGTAKPSRELQACVPHHLIDILDPREWYSVGDFVRDCERCIEDIQGRGRIPIIVGGTPFYIKTFLYGLPETPVVTLSVRRLIATRMQAQGLAQSWKELHAHDPVSAERIHPHDRYRISRALEILDVTGRPPSSFQLPQHMRRDYRITVLGLFHERDILKERVTRRVMQMMEEGLAEEIQSLFKDGVSPEDPGMRAIGYREFCRTRSEDSGRWNPEQLKEIATEVIRSSWDYAKRQIRFFQRLSCVEWIHAGAIDKIKERIRVGT